MESAVEFATQSRIHMALAVNNLEQSQAFYRVLFGQSPTKVRPHYAKFEVADPPVNLSLNEVAGEIQPRHPAAHFGVQVKSTQAVKEIAARLAAAELQTITENAVSCCYAVQNKVWATDPDGNKWEVYVLLEDYGEHHSNATGCCPTMVEFGLFSACPTAS
jgi:catechol 2,3-dioxygenase-like lactoylglutathione lyase family enzyme